MSFSYFFSEVPSIASGDSVPAALVAKVTNTLRWVYLLEEYRPASVLSAVPLRLKLSRLLCTFLAGVCFLLL